MEASTMSPPEYEESPSSTPASSSKRSRMKRNIGRLHTRLSHLHTRTPYLRSLPLAAILIIALLILINLLVWAICGLILTRHTHLLSTAALAYTLGLRHALDADHISAIDLMTRRLIATGARPVTVGTFFSLGHSTIVVVTSIVVAATAAGISSRFDSFGTVGGIIGSSIRKVIRLQPDQEQAEAWKIEGGGCLFRALKRAFKLIDRPWKMYPLGVLFGLGFDTSSEIALLGISSIQGAKGTNMWLILVFPVLFTVGMCLVDTIDGALMMSLYVAPMGMGGDDKKEDQAQRDFDQAIMASSAHPDEQEPNFGPGGHGRVLLDDDDDNDVERAATATATAPAQDQDQQQQRQKNDHTPRVKDPLTFLYYSIVLTTLTVICAIIIGIIQLLSMILNVATPKGRFWDGVEVAGDNYEIIGGSICASFIVFGGISVLCYKPWRRWVDRKRDRLRGVGSGGGGCGYGANASSHGSRETSSSIPAWAAAAHERETERERDLNILEEQEDLVSVLPGPDHGEAEELVEVRGKTSTQRVGVKAFEADDNLTIPGASGGTR
ncbi:hypothetical protein LTS03_006795 [Exophiala xenobiotica]|nr:hypothetical protein LTR92_010023 [Exophiala xenobiotica]KAK5248331.1 hypothetical protein LTS06_006651 [Exophiala xenobiotica]KAK5347870.1 hypothetical protein LTR61_008499 [Exophiala xenobiotica]KAK5369664.1 hypothetical protein LTR11_006996 [Exophiala xenobiotica]KAK5371697.1 hypothetical protein LTS03_006795 [Exophiala xenobiotica]